MFYSLLFSFYVLYSLCFFLFRTSSRFFFFFFFFNDPATPEIYTLPLHDALPIWGVRRSRRDDLDVGARLTHSRRRVAERGPEPLHLQGATPREQSEYRTLAVESEHAPGLGTGWRRRAIFQRMPDERSRHAVVAKERLLEGEDDGEPAHRGQFAHPARRPGPHLGRDVVQDRNAQSGGFRRHAQVIAGIVGEDRGIGAARP